MTEIQLYVIPEVFCGLFVYVYSFIWLHQVLVEAHGLFIRGAGFSAISRACGLSSWSLWAQSPYVWNLRSPTRDQIHITCIGRWILNHWTARKSLGWQLWSLIQLHILTAQHCIIQLFLFCYLLSISGVHTILTLFAHSRLKKDCQRHVKGMPHR